jgi:hypothetical protein
LKVKKVALEVDEFPGVVDVFGKLDSAEARGSEEHDEGGKLHGWWMGAMLLWRGIYLDGACLSG